MLKSKKFQIAAFAAAIVMAVSGIVMVAYAASLAQKTINGKITYNPDYITVTGNYYVYGGGGTTETSNGDFNVANGTAAISNITVTDPSGFVVFKLVLMTTKFATVDCAITATGTNIEAFECTNTTGSSPSALGETMTLIKNQGANVFIRINLKGDPVPGEMPFNINIDVTDAKA